MPNNQKIPEGWSVKKLGLCLSLLKDGTHGTHIDVPNGIMLLSAKDVINGQIILSKDSRRISIGDFNLLHKKYHIQNGDVVLTIVGTIGRCAIIDNYNDNYTFQRSVAILRPYKEITSKYLLTYIQGSSFQKELLKRQSVSAQPGVYLDDLSKIYLLLPPLPEQEKIAEILGTWDEAIEKLSSLIEQKKLLKKGLMQKLLTGKVRLLKTSPLAGEVADLSASEGLDNQQSESIQNKKITNTLAYRQDCPLTSPLAGEVADLSASEGLDNNDNIKISSHQMYQPYIKEFSRDMRKNSTKAENLLWQKIRNGQLGFKFRRQHQIDNKYIADFICLEKRLIIELDGGQHNDRPKDKDRTLYLENNNFKVIRFWDNEILQNIDGCLEILLKEISLLNNPSPCPSPARGEGISATYSNSLPQGAMKDVEYSFDTPHLAQECHPLPQGARKDDECSLDTPHLAQECHSLPQGARKDEECSLDTPHLAQKCHPLPQGARKNERFSQPWKAIKLGEIAEFAKGKQLNKLDMIETGIYPVLNGGITYSGYTDDWNAEKGTITVSEGGNSCGYVNYIKERFWCSGHCYVVNNIKVNKFFLYHLLKLNEQDIMKLRVGSGLPNIQISSINKFKVSVPSDISEQQAIANVLSTADDEIDLLNKKLILFKEQKKGLMQQLLTGNIRVKVN